MFFFRSFSSGYFGQCRTLHLPGGLRQDGAHHQHHRGAQQQLRPAQAAELPHGAPRLRVERRCCLLRYPRYVLLCCPFPWLINGPKLDSVLLV
jgi:hypothetical protein